MTQECESILSAAERVQRKNSKKKKGLIIVDSDDEKGKEEGPNSEVKSLIPLDGEYQFKVYEKNLADWTSQMDKFMKEHKSNEK